MLTQYGNLYPWMTKAGPKLDLAVYEQIAAQREDLIGTLDCAVTDSRYMPLSRDMSMSRRKAMLTWLTNLGSDGKPLLGEERAPREAATAPAPPAAEPAGADAELGGKTAAAQRRRFAPR